VTSWRRTSFTLIFPVRVLKVSTARVTEMVIADAGDVAATVHELEGVFFSPKRWGSRLTCIRTKRKDRISGGRAGKEKGRSDTP
jgi:hypothetical protein